MQHFQAIVPANAQLRFVLPVSSPLTPALLWLDTEIAELFGQQGHWREAASMYERLIGVAQRLHGPAVKHTRYLLSQLAFALHELGHHEQAKQMHMQVRNAQRQAGLGDGEPEVLATRHELALLSENPEAELAEVARLKAEINGPQHRYPAQSEAALAFEFAQQGRVAEAQALLQRTGDIFRRMDGPHHSETLVNDLSVAILNLNDVTSVEELKERLAEVRG